MGSTRDGVRAWRRHSLGLVGDWRALDLFLGGESFGVGGGIGAHWAFGGQWSQEEVDGLWSSQGMDVSIAIGGAFDGMVYRGP